MFLAFGGEFVDDAGPLARKGWGAGISRAVLNDPPRASISFSAG